MSLTSLLSFPHSRIWGRIHRNHIQRQSGRQEIPGLLHKVSGCGITPDAAEYEFMLLYVCWIFIHISFVNRDEVVVAAASLMFDPAVARLAELMATGQILTKAQAQ